MKSFFHRVFNSSTDASMGEVFEEAQKQPILVPAFHVVVIRLFILSFNQYGKNLLSEPKFDPKRCEQWLKDRASLQEFIKNEEYIVVTPLLGDELFERKMRVFKNWKGAVRSLVTNTCSMEEAMATLEKGKEMQAEETEEFCLLEEKIEEAHSWQTAINAALENGERGP